MPSMARFRQVVKKCVVGLISRRPSVRKRLERFGDLFVRIGRLDLNNEMESNGEMLVQEAVIMNSPRESPLVVFDVGANRGLWTEHFLRRCKALKRQDAVVHAFEPCEATFKMLLETIEAGGLTEKVRPVQCALSNSCGTAVLNVVGDGVGSNSLHRQGGMYFERTETVQLLTVDEYCKSTGLKQITFLKIDAEAHDLRVMEGAAEMLKAKAVGVLQFEYSHRWLFARHYLRDAFDLLRPLGYRIGKVTPKGIEFYTAWTQSLESFREGNYVGCLEGGVGRLPQIPATA